MIAEWKSFLETKGAKFLGAGEDYSEQRQAAWMQRAILTDLSHTGLLGITGNDAATFLQGQTTCDIREVSTTTSRLGAICNPHGRVITTFRVLQRKGDFYLTQALESVAPNIQYLSKYLLRSRVKLRDASQDWIRIGGAGAAVADALRERFSIPSGGTDQVFQTDTTTVLRVGDDPPRFEILAPYAQMTQLWDALAAQAQPVGADLWASLEILSGFPTLTPAISGEFTPHMLNLPELGAVSFTKGCYTGQEVVARTQYLGKTKRRIYRFRIREQLQLEPGAILWAPIENSPEHSGKIINSAPNPDGAGIIGLAVISDAALESGSLRLGDAQGLNIELF